MKSKKRNLVVFARAPRYGLVKKRLSKDVGSSEALRYYRTIFYRSLRVLHDNNKRWNSWLAITPNNCMLNSAYSKNWRIFDQDAGNLGARMLKVLLLMPIGQTVLVGSDIPNLQKQNIVNAFNLLDRNDLVFGPANDGGFWLIGIRKNFSLGNKKYRRMFDSVRWSSRFALSDTLKNTVSHKVGFVEEMEDVDDVVVYKRYLS